MGTTWQQWWVAGVLGLPWWGMALVLLAATQLTIFAVTLYLHRSQAHRGVDFHPVVAHVFRCWLWLTTSMITREWVAIHRKHHAHVETEHDPHSPVVLGIGTVLRKGAELYRQARSNREDMAHYGRGTPEDWVERHVYTPYANLGPVVLLLAWLLLFGLPGVAMWAVQMAWIPVWAAGVINGMGHWWGYRNFESADHSTNLTPWALWIGGEELHNNHHAFPSSSRFSMRRWELDIGWGAICILRRLGLATVLRVAPQLDVRPNIAVPDADTLKALLVHRFHAMTDYHRHVLTPALRAEARATGARLRALLPRRQRRGLASDGRWLCAEHRQQLQQWVAERPQIAELVAYRVRLMAVLEARGQDAGQRLAQLQAWCAEAEASGSAALQDFARRMKGYRLVGA